MNSILKLRNGSQKSNYICGKNKCCSSLILCENVNKYTIISFYVHHVNINLDQCFKNVIMSNISD